MTSSRDLSDLFLFGGIAVLVLGGMKGTNWFIRHRAEKWTEVTGHIESGDVYARYGASTLGPLPRQTAVVTAQLSYSYRVHGEYYAGSVTRPFADEQRAWNFVNANKGKEILVRYPPKNPEKSVVWKVLSEVDDAG